MIGMVDFDLRSFRLRVILGDAYIGTQLPHVWTGGPAAIEIDLHRGIEEMVGGIKPVDQLVFRSTSSTASGCWR